MLNISSKLVLLGLLGSVVLLSACVTEPTCYDQKFGDAVNAAKAQQTINPDASNKVHRERGFDGTTAKHVMDRYHKGSENPPPPVSVFTIGVSGGK